MCKTLGCSQMSSILPPETGDEPIDRNCMLACDVCEHRTSLLGYRLLWEGHPSTSCCSAFHSSIVQVRLLRGEGTRRSVAGHGPVYSLLVCSRHLPALCETVTCVSSASIADRLRVVKRRVLSFRVASICHPLLAACRSARCPDLVLLVWTRKRAKEFIRIDKALGRHDP
jgi:hypothetical protein